MEKGKEIEKILTEELGTMYPYEKFKAIKDRILSLEHLEKRRKVAISPSQETVAVEIDGKMKLFHDPNIIFASIAKEEDIKVVLQELGYDDFEGYISDSSIEIIAKAIHRLNHDTI